MSKTLKKLPPYYECFLNGIFITDISRVSLESRQRLIRLLWDWINTSMKEKMNLESELSYNQEKTVEKLVKLFKKDSYSIDD